MSLINMLDFAGGNKTPLILQNEANECGLASLAMVASYHGYKTDLASLRNSHSGTARGARLADLIYSANQLKLSARAVKADLADLNRLTLPAILHWDFNHFVVLTRITGKQLVIHDPGKGRQRLSLDEVSARYTGVALELFPQADFEVRKQISRISLRRLLGNIQGLPRVVSTVVLLALALEVFTLASPLFMQLVVDSAIVSSDKDLLTVLALGFLLLGLVQVGVSLLRGWVVMVISNQLNLQLQSNLFRHMIRLPMIWFERRHLGDVISRFDSMSAIQSTLTGSFLTAIIDGLMVVTTLIMMLIYAGSLSAIVVAAAISYAVARLVLYQPLRQAQEEQIARGATSQTHFLETARGIQSIKLFSRQVLRRTQYESLMVEQFNAGIRVQKLGLIYNSINGSIFALENIIVVWIAGMMILDGGFSVGMLFAFLAYKQQFISRTTALIEKGIELRMLSLHTERVADIALSEVEPENPRAEKLALMEKADIFVSGLSFRYSENESTILNDISFHVREGESVALVGPSGCGKTTLVKLLLGLLAPDEGEILIGGHALTHLDINRYREQVGTVMQDDQLFAGSITENITFFDPSPDAERVKHVAELAGIHRDIAGMPLQYHSMIGDMGSVLSGGQKQRLLLARALYKQPRLLILDEATSHLDVGTERQVSDAVMQLPVTRLIIAHRPETIASADRVIDLSAMNSTDTVRPVTPRLNKDRLPATA